MSKIELPIDRQKKLQELYKQCMQTVQFRPPKSERPGRCVDLDVGLTHQWRCLVDTRQVGDEVREGIG